MTWKANYHPATIDPWHGRKDAPHGACLFQHVKLLPLDKLHTASLPGFAFLGFCCDEGIRRNEGRPGAALGPGIIRELLAKMPYRRTDAACYDVGNIVCHDGDLEKAQRALGEAVALIRAQHLTPILLGGGHEMAWGHFQGLVPQTSIVNFDAHFDLRPLLHNQLGSSGTPFLQIADFQQSHQHAFDYHVIGIQQTGNIEALYETAKSRHTHILPAETIQLNQSTAIEKFMQPILSADKPLYVSICMDVFAEAYAPGVSAPQTLGLTPWQVLPLLRQLSQSRKVQSYDIAELSPPNDIALRTARLAATLVHDILHHHVF